MCPLNLKLRLVLAVARNLEVEQQVLEIVNLVEKVGLFNLDELVRMVKILLGDCCFLSFSVQFCLQKPTAAVRCTVPDHTDLIRVC